VIICILNLKYTTQSQSAGSNYADELVEWSRQIKRWTIGAAEVFHYFVIKCNRLPVHASVSWGVRFVAYYGLLLCVTPLFSLCAPPLLYVFTQMTQSPVHTVGLLDWTTINYALGAHALAMYVWLASVFTVNAAAAPAFPDAIVDTTPMWRSCAHWIASPFTLVAYACVGMYAYVDVSVRGKSVCTHDASKKDNLTITTLLSCSHTAPVMACERRPVHHSITRRHKSV
jgi:hypothetical protein